jgi:deoxyribodipyrimidine photo-lyase
VQGSPEPGYSGSLCEGEGCSQVFGKLVKPLLAKPDIPHDSNKEVTHEYRPDQRSAFPYQGGEAEALRRLDDYFFKGNSPPVRSYKTTRNGLLGHAYSTKFSPFLALGCISPRKIIHSLWDHEAKFGSNKDTYWVLFEVLWRDYFIFISQKFALFSSLLYPLDRLILILQLMC